MVPTVKLVPPPSCGVDAACSACGEASLEEEGTRLGKGVDSSDASRRTAEPCGPSCGMSRSANCKLKGPAALEQ